MSRFKDLEKKPIPNPPRLRDLIGPSFIMLGLGLGSGELILWPFLASNYGMGIIWGAVLGITFQFFINMEIERYTLAKGESVFVGFARRFGALSPIWFILSTILPWMWPGIIASCATLIASMLGIEYTPVIPILILLLIGVAITLGPVIYKTQEVFQRTLITIGVPFIFLLTLVLASPPDWEVLAEGFIGKGDGYWFLPAGISLATFIGAFAYSGAGGNLNLAQSFYVKEKGYGMGKYSGRITSILTGKKEEIKLEGADFPENKESFALFGKWWKRINIEHALVFWATGAFTMIILSLLAFVTVFQSGAESGGISFLLAEGAVIASRTLPVLGLLFLIISAAMLFSTQFSILDATSRIMSENLVILSPEKFKVKGIRKFYFVFLWVQIAAGIIIFLLGFTEPLPLVILSAVLNAIAMFFYSGLILWLNFTSLPKEIRPNAFRSIFVIAAFVFYGVFSAVVIFQNFFG